jgi:hypothetical protein
MAHAAQTPSGTDGTGAGRGDPSGRLTTRFQLGVLIVPPAVVSWFAIAW